MRSPLPFPAWMPFSCQSTKHGERAALLYQTVVASAVSKSVEVPGVLGNRGKNLVLEEILGPQKLEYAVYVSQVCDTKIHSQKDMSQELTALALTLFVTIPQQDHNAKFEFATRGVHFPQN